MTDDEQMVEEQPEAEEEFEYVYEDEDEPGFQAQEDDEEWNGAYVRGLNELDGKLGRRLTDVELDGIFERAQHQDEPDVEGAFNKHYETRGEKPLDLATSAGRTEYMRQRLLEQQQDD